MCVQALGSSWQIRARGTVPGPRTAALFGAAAATGLFGLLAFGTVHAVVIVPIWSQLVGGIPFALAAGLALTFAFDATTHARGWRTIADGLTVGATVFATMIPGTLVASTLRVSGIRIGESVDMTLYVALAVISGAVAGFVVTGQRRGASVFAVAALVFMLGAHGPLPVAQSIRGAWLAASFLPICLAGGALTAAIRQFTSEQETTS